MRLSTSSKLGYVALLGMAFAALPCSAQTSGQSDSIFSRVDSSVRDRMFFRISYINANVKTTSSEVKDVTGPVLARGDIDKYFGTDDGSGGLDHFSHYFVKNDGTTQIDYGLAKTNLEKGMTDQANVACEAVRNGIGSPCGITGKSSTELGTLALGVGYFLDDAYKWALEAFVLAAPLKASVYGGGANHLNGQKILETKMLPPIVQLGRYFGEAKDAFRPYLGLAASYAFFYDSRATSTLNSFVGGDTTVKLKNSFGAGPVFGFKYEPQASAWSVNFNIGKLRYKTEATLTTHDTVITSSSQVLKDYGPYLDYAITNGTKIYTGANAIYVSPGAVPAGYTAGQQVFLTDALMCDLAKAKNNSDSCNLGTFVRKSNTVLDSTMFMFSVGHAF
jgi:outer membrane protein W